MVWIRNVCKQAELLIGEVMRLMSPFQIQYPSNGELKLWKQSLFWETETMVCNDSLQITGKVKWRSEVTQSCPILCDLVDCSLPGCSVHGILQARILEWVAISFSGDLPDPGIEPGSPTLRADALQSEPPGKPLNTGKVFIFNSRFSLNPW